MSVARSVLAAFMLVMSLSYSLADQAAPASAELPSVSTDTLFDAGAYIVDMGQSADPAVDVLPYGFVYELVVNQQIPVFWAIRNDKVKDGTIDEIDFSVDGTDYRGGAFIVPAEFVAEALPTITTFQGQGVKIDGPVSAFDAPLFSEITAWPNAVLDAGKGGIVAGYYVNAGIPTDAYREGLPSDLTDCDDIYVMPHADPEWDSHSNLVPFNDDGGYIWAACHAVSVLENVDDPASPDPAPDMNFLSVDGLIDFGDHDGGDGDYAYNAAEGGDPIFQFIGRIDSATENGSEQIYLPSDGGWRPSSKVLVWDDNHPEVPSASPGEASKLVYGRGFGDETNGLVMYEGGHSHSKGDGADVVAAQRAFFNLHLLAGIERGIEVDVTTPETIGGGETVPVSAVIDGGAHNYNWEWTSSCGGSFAEATGAEAGSPLLVSTTFTAPPSAGDCTVRLKVSDTCGRGAFGVSAAEIVEFTDLGITKTDNIDPAEAGSSLVYTLTVTNAGPSDATNTTVIDTLPPEVNFVSATPGQGSCVFLGGTVECNLGTVTTSAPVTIDITVDIDPDASGTITNSAAVSADQPDTDPTDNNVSEDTLTGAIGLTLDKSADPAFLDGAGNVTYSFVVGNDGPNDLTSVVLNDSDCAPQIRQPDLIGDDDDVLEPGERWEYTCTTLVSADVTNSADVTAIDPLLGPITVGDTADVDVIAPSISIAKNPATQDAPENGEAVFDVVITNDGDADLVNVFVTDPLAPSCERFLRSLPIGESITYACALTVDAAGTSGTNTIDVTASDPGGNDVTAQDTADWTVIPSDLTITKANDATGPLVPGDAVTYTIEVENTGATTQNDVVVTDVLPAGFNWVSTNVERLVQVVDDDFSRDVEKQYPLGWAEWNDDSPADSGSGDIKHDDCSGVDCKVLLKKTDKGIYQPIDLTGVASATVTFDVATLNNDNDGGEALELVVWDGASWQIVASFPLATTGLPTGFTTESETFDPSAHSGAIAAGRIGLRTSTSNDDKDEIHLDNVSITWSGGSITDPFLDPGNDYYFGWGDDGSIPGNKFDGDAQVVDSDDDSKCDTNVDCVLRLNKDETDVFFPNDLTGVASATVTFDWATFENDNDGGEALELVVWDDDSSSWQIVESYALATAGIPTGFTTETETFDPSALGADDVAGRIGFRSSSSNDDKDTIFVDNVTISVLATVAGNPSPNLVTAGDDVDIPVGGKITVTVGTTIDPGLTVFYPLDQVNTASTTSDETITPVQAASAVQVVVPGVNLTKTADPTIASPGDPVTYTFVVTNTGNDPVTPVVADPDCSPITLGSGDTANPGILDVLEEWTYSCTTTSPVSDNTATVSATDSLGNPVDPAQDSAAVEIVDSAIAVTKATSTPVIRGGESATYSYEVTTGASAEALTSVFVSDDSCASVTPVMAAAFNVGDTSVDGALNGGETWLFSCETELVATTTNTATAEGVDRAAKTVTDTDTVIVQVIEPAIAIDKTKLAPADPVPAGATVTFGFGVTNPGNDPLGNVAVADNRCAPVTLVGGDTANAGFLDPGETWSYTCDAPLDADTVNIASVSGTDSLGGTVSAEDNLFVDVLGAEIALGKSAAPTVVDVGAATTYTYKVYNLGDTTFFDFDGTGTLDDDSCAPLTRIADLPGFGDNDIDLEPGETWRYECNSTIGGDVTNTFTAQGVDELGDTVIGEPVSQFVAALDTTLDVVKSADQTVVSGGTSVTFTYEVTHAGSIPTIFNAITITGITDDTCSTVSYVGGDTDSDGELSFDIDPASATFGQPETWTYTCTTTVDSTTTNTVTVSGNNAVGDPIADATATETVSVSNPDLTVVKTAGNAADGETEYIVEGSGPVTYTYVVDNTGDDPLTNVAVIDSPACTPITLLSGDIANSGVLDPDETWTYQCSQDVSTDVTNTVTVSADDLAGNPIERTDDAVVDVVGPEVSIDKTAYIGTDAGASCPGTDTAAGDPTDALTYCFVVSNTGDTDLDGIAIDDADLGIDETDMTMLSGMFPLAPGNSATWYYETNVAAVGDLLNTGTVTANPTDGSGVDLPDIGDVTASDSATVTEANPGLALAKTVTAGTPCPGVDSLVVGEGQALTYCFEVSNTGDSHVDAIVIDDADLGGLLTVSPDPSTVGPLAPGSSVTFEYATVAGPADIVNTATASAAPTDASGIVLPDVDPPVSSPDSATVDVVSPAIGIAKTVAWGSGASCPGVESLVAAADDPVTYCFDVTNTGDVDLAAIAFSDATLGIDETDLVPDPSTVVPLVPLATVTFTYQTLVAGDVTNTASVSATPVDDGGDPVPGAPIPSDDDTAAIDEMAPAVTIEKTVYAGHDDGASCAGSDLVQSDLGGDVTYCFVVTNSGDTHLDDITITDPDVGVTDADLIAITADPIPLAPGGSLTFYYEASFDQVNAGSTFVNTADVSSNPTTSAGVDLPNLMDAAASDGATVETTDPQLSLAKTVYLGHDGGASCGGSELARAGIGSSITYCFELENTGGSFLDAPTVDDADLGIDETAMTALSGDFPLAPGALAVWYFETIVSGDLTNTADVSATPTDIDGTPTGQVPPTASDTADVDQPSPAAALAKTIYVGHDGGTGCDGDPTVSGGSGLEVTYCFTVTNSGDTHLDAITVDDPALGITETEMTLAAGTIPLAPGSSATWYFETTTDGDLTNVATMTANPTEATGVDIPGLADVADDGTATVDETPFGLDLAKTVYAGHDGGIGCPGVGRQFVGSGQAVTYCFEVTNTSAAPTHLDSVNIVDADVGIGLTDMTLASGTFPLAPGSSAVYYHETSATADLVNTADASANPVAADGSDLPGLADPTSQSQAEVDVVSPALELAKTVYQGHDDGTSCAAGQETIPAANGDAVTYCFRVSNTGDVDLDDIVIVDADIDLSILSPDPATLAPLAPGSSQVFFAESTVDGDLTNTASASATPVGPSGDAVPGAVGPSDDDVAEVDEVEPGLSLVKTAAIGVAPSVACPGADVVVADDGDPLVYCFELTNTGDTHLDGVVISDSTLGITEADMTLISGGLPLAPGASLIYAYATAVNGDLVNSADASANPTDAAGVDLAGIDDPTASDTAEVDEVAPGLTIEKTVYEDHDGGGSCGGVDSLFAAADAAITWCFEVTNTGDTHLDTITIGDPALGITESDMGQASGSLPLPPGETATWYFETTVDGDLDNTALASATPTDAVGDILGDVDRPVSEPDSAEVELAEPDLVLAKTVYVGHDAGAGCPGDDLVQGGNGLLVTYCFELINSGDSHLADLSLDDPALGVGIAGLTEVAGDKTLPLAPGSSIVLYYETVIDGSLDNVATASGSPTDENGVPVFGATPPEAIDQATAEETSIAIDLVNSVYVGHDGGAGCSGEPGIVVVQDDPVTYCFVVTNTSAAPTHLDEVEIDDSTLGVDVADMTLVSGTFPLAPETSALFAYATTATGDLVNVTAASATPTDAVGNALPGVEAPVDTGDAEVVVVQPVIDVVKAVDQPLVDPGATVRWTSTVTNAGDVLLGNVVFNDESCPGGAVGPVKIQGDDDDFLDADDVWQYTCDEQLFEDRTSGADVQAQAFWFGPVGVLVAKLTTSGGRGAAVAIPPDNLVGGSGTVSDVDAASARVRLIDLGLTKTLDGDLVAGQESSYSLVVTNNGRDDATEVVVTDELPAGLTVVEAVGDGWVCTTSESLATCDRATLPAGGSASIVLIVAVATDAVGDIANDASVASAQAESVAVLGNNTGRAVGAVAAADGTPLLAFTGRDSLIVALWAMALLLAGAGLVFWARRLRRRPTA